MALVFTDLMIDSAHGFRANGCHAVVDWTCALPGGGRRHGARIRNFRRDARAANAGHDRRAPLDRTRRGRALALRAGALAEIRPMRRAHRSFHRVLWPVLALVVALGLAMAFILRPPLEKTASSSAETAQARRP